MIASGNRISCHRILDAWKRHIFGNVLTGLLRKLSQMVLGFCKTLFPAPFRIEVVENSGGNRLLLRVRQLLDRGQGSFEHLVHLPDFRVVWIGEEVAVGGFDFENGWGTRIRT